MNIVSAVILCTIVGAVGAIVLVAAAKVHGGGGRPRIEEVSACLAGANCGGCGYAGCADYAKAVVHGRRAPATSAPRRPQGCCCHCQDHGRRGKRVEKKAVVQCQGSSEHCKPATTTRASRPVPLRQPCTAAPRPAPSPALVWATAPRCVSSTPSTSWTVWQRWTRTSAPAVVPAPTSAPSRSS